MFIQQYNGISLRFSARANDEHLRTQFRVWDESRGGYKTATGQALQYEINQLAPKLRTIYSYRDTMQRSTTKEEGFILPMVDDLISTYHRPDHAYLTAQAAIDMTKPERKWTGRPFAELFPALLYYYPPGFASPLTSAVENFMDSNTRSRSHHPNMAEFLGLLNHPKLPKITEPTEAVEDLTQTISSVPHWLNHDKIDIYLEKVLNWQRIGFLTHAFKLWRFDCQQYATPGNPKEKKALIERSPLEFAKVGKRITDDPVNGHPGFGPGFVLIGRPDKVNLINDKGRPIAENFDPKTWIEMRRGYLLINHPEHGTLIIRNSSTHYGRNGLQHPAYWRKAGYSRPTMTAKELLELTPQQIEKHFSPITRTKINNPEYDLDTHLDFLLTQFIGLKNAQDAWKFDSNYYTSAITIKRRRKPKPDGDKQPEEKKAGPLASLFRSAKDKILGRKKTQPPTSLDVRKLTGGPASAGFAEILNLLQARITERATLKKEIKHLQSNPTAQATNRIAEIRQELNRKPLPALAFFHPDFAPFVSTPFETPKGETQEALKITPKRLKALKVAHKYPKAFRVYEKLGIGIQKGKITAVSQRERFKELRAKLSRADQLMKRTGVKSFLQAGINTGGSLVLVEA